MIILSDLHTKKNPLYYKAVIKLLQWVLNKFPNENIIQLGDLFDTSTIHSDVMYELTDILKKFKHLYIIQGNHDISFRSGSIVKPLNHHETITVFDKDTEIEIEGHKCLMLPHQHNCKYYEDLEGTYDFIFTHTMPEEERWGGDYINLSKLKGKKIYGHIHTKANYPDAYIMGVPIITRFGESNNAIAEITLDKEIKEIEVPVFFDIVDIEFGEEMVNKDYLYNVKNAPSNKSVYDMYPYLNIREEGITILYKTEDEDSLVLDKNANDLKVLYKTFCEEKEIEDYIIKEGITSFTECGI